MPAKAKRRPSDPKWESYGWWWRDPNRYIHSTISHQVRPKDESEAQEWKAGTERVAWTYELVRRLGFKTWPPYPELEYFTKILLEREVAASLPWASSPSLPVWDHCLNQPGPEWFSSNGFWWNLKVTDQTLMRRFQALIIAARKSKRIETPHPNAGVKCKPPSWRWPEVLDLKAQGQILSESERKMLNSARGRARSAETVVTNVLRRAATVAVRHLEEIESPLSTAGSEWRPTIGPRSRRPPARPE